MKCPKCGEKLERIVDKKYPAVYLGHRYPFSLNTDFSKLCDYSKRIK